MEDKSEGKGDTEDIQTKPHASNYKPQRPTTFSLERRNEIYYFSDDSNRGILKRVPLKYGSYQLNELETVSDRTGVQIGTEIGSDVPENISASSKCTDNSIAPHDHDSYESEDDDRKREIASKRLDKTAGCTPWASGSKNLSIPECHRNYAETKIDDEKPLEDIHQDQMEQIDHEQMKDEKSSVQIVTEIFSDVPENIYASSKCIDNSHYPHDHDSYESEDDDRKREIASRRLYKTAGCTPWASGSKNLSIPECHRNYPETKNDDEKPLEDINQDPMEQISHEQMKDKKELSYTAYLQSNPRKLKRYAKKDKNKKHSYSYIKTPMKPDDHKRSLENLSNIWTEDSLNDALDHMSMKTPVTEL